MLSVAPDRFSQVVELVRHRLVDRLARVLHVLAERLGDLLGGHEIHHLRGPASGPAGSTATRASSGGARHVPGFARERARRALAASPNHQRDPRAGYDPEDRRGEQIVLLALTLACPVLSV